MTDRSLWRCEKCNAYHVGGLDLHEQEDESMRAVCGATWTEDAPSDEVWQTPYVVTDPYGADALL